MQGTGSAYAAGRYAAIDIGTVTARLLIADIDEQGRVTSVDRRTCIVNLGEGVDETRRLKPEAIERVAQAVGEFVAAVRQCEEADGLPIELHAITTSAARDAANGGELIERLAQEGIDLQIIEGTREASLSFAGASSAFPGERIIVVDAGGGSTEVIAGMAGSEPDRVHSFNVGCRRVTERFFSADPPEASSVREARAWMHEEFTPYFEELRADGLLDGSRMVAVAGTATSAVSMHKQMEVYDSSRVHLSPMGVDSLEEMAARLGSIPLEQRQHVVGLDPKRAPVIVAGLLGLLEVMRAGGFSEYTTSECDILHGVILFAARGL